MIKVKGLSYQKGRKEILKNIEIQISKNKITGILGPNGSGKTSLLKHLVRDIESKDCIFLEGKPIATIPRKEFARKITFVAQNIHPIEEILIEELVRMGRYPYKKMFLNYGEEDLKIVEDVLQMFQLKEIRKKTIREVSGGELKRAFLARAFAQQTEIIILDEPTNHLDVKHQLELMTLLKGVEEKTIICSIHDIALALEFCDEIILLKEGEVVVSGRTEKVLTEAQIEEVFEVKNHIEKVKGKKTILYYDERKQ